MEYENIDQAIQHLDEIKNYLLTLKGLPQEASKQFDILSALLESQEWPNAVPENLICDINDEAELVERAGGIADLMIEQSFVDAKFLDFGCGTGHVATYAAAQKTKVSVGYDIAKIGSLTWEQEGNCLLTTQYDKVLRNAPYDIILVYDVLDHIAAEDINSVVKKLKELSNAGTRLYVRCHPWCSRHGGHYYLQNNKAFIHLVFNDDELKKLGLTSMPTEKVIYPINTYKTMWVKHGFHIIHQDISRSSIEDFFHTNSLVKNRITSRWTENTKNWPQWQMEQSFIDYILKLR